MLRGDLSLSKYYDLKVLTSGRQCSRCTVHTPENINSNEPLRTTVKHEGPRKLRAWARRQNDLRACFVSNSTLFREEVWAVLNHRHPQERSNRRGFFREISRLNFESPVALHRFCFERTCWYARKDLLKFKE